MDRWKEIYLGIRAEAEAAGAVIYFADEAGIRSDYHAGTTWSRWADPGGEEHRGPVFGEHDLRGVREGRAAVRRL